MAGKRPVYLNLFKIRQPLPAVVSVLHRISGAVLFLVIPLFLTGLQQTLASADEFEAARLFLASFPAKLAILGLVWAYLHHFFAGLRFLALDLHIGGDLRPARKTGAAVLVGSGALTLLYGAWLW